MNSILEIIKEFGWKELILTIVTIAIIVLAREERHIFRRKKNDTPPSS